MQHTTPHLLVLGEMWAMAFESSARVGYGTDEETAAPNASSLGLRVQVLHVPRFPAKTTG